MYPSAYMAKDNTHAQTDQGQSFDFNKDRGESDVDTQKRLSELGDKINQQTGAHLSVVRNVHEKIVTIDDQIICIGSFNWFSAVRESNERRNNESSVIYRGDNAGREIATHKARLEKAKDLISQ